MNKQARTPIREQRTPRRAIKTCRRADQLQVNANQQQELETTKHVCNQVIQTEGLPLSQETPKVLLKQIRHLNNLYTKCMDVRTGKVEVWSGSTQSNIFMLGQLNSLEVLPNGHITNVMDPSYKEDSWSISKETHCFCKQSHCKKKYCECFRNGNPCGPRCRCTDCGNFQFHGVELAASKCRCSSSKCLSKYCKCRKQEKTCTQECECFSCENNLVNG